jgi:hypothetical protein
MPTAQDYFDMTAGAPAQQGNVLDGILQAGGGLFGVNKGIQQARQAGNAALAATTQAGKNAISNTAFKPFAVTSNTGNVGVDVDGGFNATLTPQQQQLADLLRTTSEGFTREAGTDFQDLFSKNLTAFGTPNVNSAFDDVSVDVGQSFLSQGLGSSNQGVSGLRENELIRMLTGGGGAGREAEVFNQLEALQAPSREREQLALENRLFNQGRSGVSTSMFGGTPEQLAQAKAVEESRASSALGAMDFTQREQAQQSGQTLQALQQGLGESQLFGELGLGGRQQALAEALGGTGSAATAAQLALEQRGQAGELGLGFLEGSFEPNQQLLDLLGPAANFAGIADAGRQQGASLAAELERAGIEGKLQSEQLAGNLEQQRIQGLTGLLGGNSDKGQGGLISGLLERLGITLPGGLI